VGGGGGLSRHKTVSQCVCVDYPDKNNQYV